MKTIKHNAFHDITNVRKNIYLLDGAMNILLWAAPRIGVPLLIVSHYVPVPTMLKLCGKLPAVPESWGSWYRAM